MPSSPPMMLIIVFTLLSIAPPMTANAHISAYQVLEEYNFPDGILPQGVSSYALDPNTGRFTVYLSDCSFKVSKYKLQYESQVSGVIRDNSLSDLNGVHAKYLIFKVKVNEVNRDGDTLKFSAGFLHATASVNAFPGIPQCGCGFSCPKINEKETKSININSTLY